MLKAEMTKTLSLFVCNAPNTTQCALFVPLGLHATTTEHKFIHLQKPCIQTLTCPFKALQSVTIKTTKFTHKLNLLVGNEFVNITKFPE